MLDDLDLESLSRRPGVKWARATAVGAVPAWIADMDFPIADEVRAALAHAIDTDLGYPAWDDRPERNPLVEAFAARMVTQYGFAPAPGHVRVFTELIQALQAVIHVATAPGDAVAMHTPAYAPFLGTIAGMSRRLITIPMVDTGRGWSFDPDRLAADVARSGCRVLVLVNPHNPTGRVFTRAELSVLAEITLRHDILVVADEIQADLTYDPHQHTSFAALAPELAARTVTLHSASKAFNLAGLRCCVAHIGDARVRAGLDALPPLLLGQPGNLGVLGTLAAWQHGGAWLADVRSVLDRNRRLVAEGLPAGVGYHAPEGTYLAWLDCRALELGRDPAAYFLDRAGVMLSAGPDYGPGGEGFARLNFATSRPVLDHILDRLRAAAP